jgi:hypothetical protein
MAVIATRTLRASAVHAVPSLPGPLFKSAKPPTAPAHKTRIRGPCLAVDSHLPGVHPYLVTAGRREHAHVGTAAVDGSLAAQLLVRVTASQAKGDAPA